MSNKVKRGNPFICEKCDVPGTGNFDKDYVSMTLVDKVVKTGEGEEDFSVVKSVKWEKQPIKEVVEADADSVGVYNIMKMVTKTGDLSLLPRDTGECNIDLSNAPENLMELKAMGVKAEKDFNKLPKEVKKGRDMKTFVEQMSQEEFDSFVKAIADRSSRKVKVDNGEK